MAKILIADDDKLIRWSLKELLSQEGYSIDTAATTEDALKQIKDNSYQIIFADIEIDYDNGFDMLKEMTSAQPHAKVIILSALSKSQVEQNTQDLGIFSVIEKPFGSTQILSLVKNALSISPQNKGGEYQEEKKNKGNKS
jgi:two-component system nitrogen regulation response regulator NtrX